MAKEPHLRRVQIYVARNGKAPLEDWMHSLRGKQTKARTLTRIDRVRLGNLGDCASVGAGVYELRIHFGPSYCVYFGLHGAEVVVLARVQRIMTIGNNADYTGAKVKSYKGFLQEELRDPELAAAYLTAALEGSAGGVSAGAAQCGRCARGGWVRGRSRPAEPADARSHAFGAGESYVSHTAGRAAGGGVDTCLCARSFCAVGSATML